MPTDADDGLPSHVRPQVGPVAERPPFLHQFTSQTIFSSDDPTATKTIRNRWSAEMYRRFRALKGVVNEAVIENDVLGLGEDAPEPTVVQPGSPVSGPDIQTDDGVVANAEAYGRALAANQGIGPDAVEPPYPGAFNFPTDEAKVDAFMGWLREQERRGILEVTEVSGREVVAHRGWQNTYVRAAYRRGMEKGEWAMETAGIDVPGETVDALFRSPQHADALGMLYTRAFSELDGVTAAMDQDISRTLADGLAQGWNPHKTAREINDRIGAVGLHRGRLIARTETIRAANEAALNRYEDLHRRIVGVTAVVEFATAGDDRVCPECLALEGEIYNIEDARGVIPVHPNCRCLWLPVPEGAEPTVAPIGASPSEAVRALPHDLPNPSADLPRFRDALYLRDRLDRVVGAESYTHAGMALNSNLTGYDGDGYLVSLASRNFSKSAGEELTRFQIAQFYTEHQPLLRRYPGLKIGAFNDVDGDLLSLDLNAVLHNREEAEALARRFNQVGIWDGFEGRFIPTGGTGQALDLSFLELLDVLEDVDSWHPSPFKAPALAEALPRGDIRAPIADGLAENYDDEAREALRWIAEGRGQTVEEFIEEVESTLRQEIPNGELRVRSWAPNSIVADGRFKSQFEVGTSGGMFNPGGRAEFERLFFGYADDLDPTERPIYGYWSHRESLDTNEMAQSYGDSIFVLKDRVKTRATVTGGDSLNAWHNLADEDRADFIPRPFLDPDHRIYSTSDLRRDAWEGVTKPHRSHGYTEIQVHGGLSLDDVDRVIFQVWKHNDPPDDDLLAKLDDLNIPYTIERIGDD